MNSNTSGSYNISLGYQSLASNTTGSQNISLGYNALSGNTTGQYNIALGSSVTSGNYSYSVILGRSATATGNNQFVVGSSGYNVGYVGTGVYSSTKYWSVVINGVAEKILLV